ncbi:thioredoxin domain-containing protein [Streptococcus hillyeri]|uniref:Thiol reductase thioredoxin n=1 Tax=Streptococcus hillyeri TaxID=2282420 RepID=A0A3L9DPE3_9STRE|nr:thioredoxin domain-containing protein [Streptococcus hillyeri]RLY01489.1 thiol reductase thioredoxin [Streptococcus hillyeri]
MTFAKDFTEITVQEAEKMIQTEEKVVLFIGRSSCPYCRRFEPKLANVAMTTGTKVFFINSENFVALSDIQVFRNTYQIPTVPGLLVANDGVVKVVCDSSLSEDAISEFITAI